MLDDISGTEHSGEPALVLTTLPDVAAAEQLVRKLLEERLIACGNVVPGVVSLYWWEGDIARESEVVVLMKTESSGVDRLFERVAELHPYTVPELLELPVRKVSRPYRRWVTESIQG